VKNLESQVEVIQANEELSVEAKVQIIARLRERVALDRAAANRLSARKQELAYEDPNPISTRDTATHFISHTEVLTDSRSNPSRWTQISRRECVAARAFFSLQEAYAAR